MKIKGHLMKHHLRWELSSFPMHLSLINCMWNINAASETTSFSGHRQTKGLFVLCSVYYCSVPTEILRWPRNAVSHNWFRLRLAVLTHRCQALKDIINYSIGLLSLTLVFISFVHVVFEECISFFCKGLLTPSVSGSVTASGRVTLIYTFAVHTHRQHLHSVIQTHSKHWRCRLMLGVN